MTKFADLHIHTHFSDSVASPEEVIQETAKMGLDCIAITDHDTIDGILPTRELGNKEGIEVLPGIEFSTEIEGKDVHILGYCFDINNERIRERILLFQNARIERVKTILTKLQEFGIDNIEVEEVCRLAQSDSVGRPHVATLLVEKGWVKDLKQAFDKYLADNASCFVPKYKQTPFEAISLIKEAGGVAVYAHPMVTSKDELIPSFIRAGIQGLEVYYPNCGPNVVNYYARLADKHGLVKVGGSDSHGATKTNTYIGKVCIPYEHVEELKERAHYS